MSVAMERVDVVARARTPRRIRHHGDERWQQFEIAQHRLPRLGGVAATEQVHRGQRPVMLRMLRTEYRVPQLLAERTAREGVPCEHQDPRMLRARPSIAGSTISPDGSVATRRLRPPREQRRPSRPRPSLGANTSVDHGELTGMHGGAAHPAETLSAFGVRCAARPGRGCPGRPRASALAGLRPARRTGAGCARGRARTHPEIRASLARSDSPRASRVTAGCAAINGGVLDTEGRLDQGGERQAAGQRRATIELGDARPWAREARPRRRLRAEPAISWSAPAFTRT